MVHKIKCVDDFSIKVERTTFVLFFNSSNYFQYSFAHLLSLLLQLKIYIYISPQTFLIDMDTNIYYLQNI